MKTKNIKILGNTNVDKDIISEPVQAGGYYSVCNGLHKVLVYTGNNLECKLVVEGTLAGEPKEEDWFQIELKDCPFTEFPIYDENHEVKSNNKVYGYSFKALPTFVRVKLLKTHEECNCDDKHTTECGNVRKVCLIYTLF